MEDENIKNENSDINELVNRAMNDISQTEKNKESSDDTQNSEMEEVDSFNGDFHERIVVLLMTLFLRLRIHLLTTL